MYLVLENSIKDLLEDKRLNFSETIKPVQTPPSSLQKVLQLAEGFYLKNSSILEAPASK
jgi:hypothetical protein